MNDWCSTHEQWFLFCPCRDNLDQDLSAVDSISLCSLPTLETPNFTPEQTPNQSSGDQASMAKAYESYAPGTYQSSSPSTKTFLDKLGFKPKSVKAAADARHRFEKDIRAYVCTPIWQYLRKEDNAPAFSALINGFLEKHGTYYWGMENRDHLAEPDPSKGYLCPRDYRREDSHFLEVMEKFFHYRAMSHRYQDTYKAKQCGKSVLATLDFATLKPTDVEALNDAGNKTSGFPEKSRRRLPEYSDVSESDPDFGNGEGPSQSRSKRRKTPHWKVKEAHVARRKSEARSQIQREVSPEDLDFGFAGDRNSFSAKARPAVKQPRTTVKKSAISVLHKRPDTQASSYRTARRDLQDDVSSSVSSYDKSPANYSTPRTTDSATRKRAEHTQMYDDQSMPSVPLRLYKQQIKDDSRTGDSKFVGDAIKRYKLQENLSSTQFLEDPDLPRRHGLFAKKSRGPSTSKPRNDAATTIVVDSDENIAYDLSPGEIKRLKASQLNTPFQTAVPSSPPEPSKIKSEPLPYEITNKITLLVSATSQQDMAPVTVNLGTYKGQNFFDFLAEECELGSKSKDVTAISATYMWDKKRHRFRKHKLETDWESFLAKLRETFAKQTDIAEDYEVEMLLHVGP